MFSFELYIVQIDNFIYTAWHKKSVFSFFLSSFKKVTTFLINILKQIHINWLLYNPTCKIKNFLNIIKYNHMHLLIRWLDLDACLLVSSVNSIGNAALAKLLTFCMFILIKEDNNDILKLNKRYIEHQTFP